jgi:hypothetical protein
VCHGCIKDLFENTIKDETAYHSMWGNRPLAAETFRGILPIAIYEQFKQKATEYDTPPARRRYCKEPAFTRSTRQCGTFLDWRPW